MSNRHGFIPEGYERMVRNEPDAFGTDLYQVLAEDGGDVVFSPSSVAGALGMAWYGARGQTAAELARALHLEDSAAPGGPGDPRNIPDPVPASYGSAVFRAPNTAWIQSGFPVQAEFTARLSHLALFPMPNVADPEDLLLSQDVIFVGGGSVANMVAVWRVHGLDQILRKAWQAGIVLTGSSAGGICWFESGTTDSFGRELRAFTDGLGLLAGSYCPHYDSEPGRRP